MLEPPDDIESWDDEEDNFFGEFGACLFPTHCVMPGEHYTSECCTWMEMARIWEAATKSCQGEMEDLTEDVAR